LCAVYCQSVLSLSLSLYYFLPFSLFIHPIYSCAAAAATNSDYSGSVSILRQFFWCNSLAFLRLSVLLCFFSSSTVF
jgi:hypothetical protein